MRHAFLTSVITCALGLLAVTKLAAQTTFIWTGLGTDHDFHTPGNWQGGLVPTGSATDNIIFNVYPQQFVTVSSSLNVGNITFNDIQDGFYLDASEAVTLTLNGDVTTTPGSRYWGIFSIPVTLAPGNHCID